VHGNCFRSTLSAGLRDIEMTNSSHRRNQEDGLRKKAVKFVVLVGILSFFADFTYEGSRSIVGPYMAILGASAAAIAIIAGLGELLGYSLRLASGRVADVTGNFWLITIVGYIVQMFSIPPLALTSSWQAAAALIVLERVGKAIRNPPRDVMLSHAGKQIGRGRAFGVHEALDQFGALVGPLMIALLLASHREYQFALAALLIPGMLCLIFLFIARWLYPKPQDLEVELPSVKTQAIPCLFWLYMGAAVLVAAGFVDYPLIAYHLQSTSTVSKDLIPVFYAVAMGVSGLGSLIFGRLYDRADFSVLIFLTAATAFFAPLVFLCNFWGSLFGAALWGLGMGVHESLIPAAVAPMVPIERRASAYGLFTAGYGVAWFLGSVVIGFLYQHSLSETVLFCVVLELAAIPILMVVRRRFRVQQHAEQSAL
jgi:MFS family permease